MKWNVSALNPGKIKEFLQKHIHIFCGFIGSPQIHLPLFLRIRHSVQHPFNITPDRGQGRAQVVGYSRHHISSGLLSFLSLPLVLQNRRLHGIEGPADILKLLVPLISDGLF